MKPKVLRSIAEEDFLKMERISTEKHEYYKGEVFLMAGASEKHNIIVANLIRELGNQLRTKPCRVYPSDMLLKIEATGLYTYPDIMVVCGERKFAQENAYILLNPEIIIEVLSDTTESYDRGKKFAHYRKLNCLKEYVLISQNQQKIEVFSINEEGHWVLTESDENQPSVILSAIGCELNHADVYEKIND